MGPSCLQIRKGATTVSALASTILCPGLLLLSAKFPAGRLACGVAEKPCSHSLLFTWTLPKSAEDTKVCCTQDFPLGYLGWEDPLKEGMATHSSIFA